MFRHCLVSYDLEYIEVSFLLQHYLSLKKSWIRYYFTIEDLEALIDDFKSTVQQSIRE